jgi:uridylate kinase
LAAEPRFKRVLLKLSGEALMGDLEYGTDPAQIERIAKQVADVQARGVGVAVVVGASRAPRRAWTAPPRTTWACWRRS